jgi:pilus assembly protein CpaE
MAENVVLIIDSEEASSQFLAQLLRQKGFKVITSTSGKDGLLRANDYLPSAIVLDTALTDITPRELIQRFQGDRRLALAPVIATSARYDAAEMQTLMAAGCVEYYAKSGSAALALVEALPRLVAESDARANKDDRGVLIVFSSAKGGIGTSSLCANLAHGLAAGLQSSTVSLIDLVLPMGSISSITGYEGPCQPGDLVQRLDANIPLEQLRECFPVPHGWGFHYLPGSPNPEVAAQFPFNRLPDIMDAMRRMFHYVIVDLGRMLSPLVLPVIQAADVIALVVGTDYDSAELSSRLLKYFLSQGIHPERVYPILNRAVGLQGLTKAQIEAALGIEVRMTMPYLIDNFTLANNLHTPFINKFPEDSASMQLKQIASEISRLAIKVRTAGMPASH